MNRLVHILSFILILLVIGAPSCVDEEEIARQEQEILDEVRADIRYEFETEYLTESSLYAHETSAKQKLIDLSDFIEVLTDTTLDISFRQKSGEMIRNLFKSENEKIRLGLLNKNPAEEMDVNQLIKKGLNNKLYIHHFNVENVQILEALHRENQYTYAGVISFSQQFNNPSNPDGDIQSFQRTSEIYVVKETKEFGNDSLNIWNVRLGQIR